MGHTVDVTRPFLIVIQHPVTTEGDNRQHLEATLRAISTLDMQAIWFWPNVDAGTGEMAERLRHFRDQTGGLTRARLMGSRDSRLRTLAKTGASRRLI